jgi:hypothetical protein
VTSAQARDLTYGGCELRPNGSLRGPASVQRREFPLEAVDPPESGGPVAGGHRAVVLIPGPESVKAAREFTAATLGGWQLGGLVEEAVIVASELVTNAIRHGTSPGAQDADGDSRVELAWQRDATRVICVVTDGSSLPPRLEDTDMCAESGRGLQVVEALAAAWGWFLLGAREKAVWAAFLLP